MKTALSAILVALAASLAGCVGDNETTGDNETPPPEDDETDGGIDVNVTIGGEEVEVGDNFFDPETLDIDAGTTVTWTNEGQLDHTVTISLAEGNGTGNSSEAGTAAQGEPVHDEQIGPGDETAFTFDEPGDYDVICRFHPGMTMDITVSE